MTALPAPLPIEALHLVISGNNQSFGQVNGCAILEMRLRRIVTLPDTLVDLQPWNIDWDAYAERIFLASDRGKPRVFVYPYSWGGGWGFLEFARALDKRGIQVKHAVLCDAVYRHWYALGQWRAVYPGTKIRLPLNVLSAEWFYQRSDFGPLRQLLDPQAWLQGDFLSGHQVVAHPKRPGSVRRGWRIHGRKHSWMDEAPEWHEAVCGVARLDVAERESVKYRVREAGGAVHGARPRMPDITDPGYHEYIPRLHCDGPEDAP